MLICRESIPPNHHSVQELCHVGYNLVIAHARAVAEFRKRKLNSKIGIVHTTNTVQTLLDTEEYRIARHRGDLFKNLWVTDRRFWDISRKIYLVC